MKASLTGLIRALLPFRVHKMTEELLLEILSLAST
jgi:hypothetical protein